MPTLVETLKQTGFTDEQIAALDPRLVTTFTTVLTTAEQKEKDARAAQAAAVAADAQAKANREAAELATRANTELYETKIVPAMTDMETEKQRLENDRIRLASENSYYKTQFEEAKKTGFIGTEVPGFDPTKAGLPPVPPAQQRDGGGRFVPGQTGSPVFTMDQIDERLGNGVSNIGWAMQEYQRLSGGQFLPDPFDKLSAEATANKLPFRDYVARKYDFATKQREINERLQREHDDKIRTEVTTESQKLIDAAKAEAAATVATERKAMAEKYGNNPDVRPAVQAQFAEVRRGVEDKTRPDPLMLSDRERHRVTRTQISERVAAQQGA